MADANKTASKIMAAGRTRIIAALAVTALVGAALGMIVLRGNDNNALLYSGLDLTESAEIAGKLDQANIRYQIRGDGSSIFVDRGQVLDARMMLSEEGLPTRGALGYEIFDKTEALGTTSFVQNINRIRALEGELARTITSLDNISGARVHLVLPERRLFERNAQTPSASVVMTVRGQGMPPSQVRAIRNLVAGSVPGLEVDRITLLDDKGRLLAAGAESREAGAMGGSADERHVAVEEQIRSKVLDVVESITGPGAARVEVAAEIDFNRITQSSEIYDPESRVVRSTSTTEETSSDQTSDPNDTVTVNNNIPEGEGDGAEGQASTSQSNSSRVQETTNYEISKTTKTEIIEGGRVQRLSVAVAVDDLRVNGEDGESVFQARTEDELARIATLVRSAVGYDEARGDTVEVVNVSFVRPEISMEGGVSTPGALDFDKNDIVRIVELVILLVGAVLLILFVLRPLIRGLITPGVAVKTSKAAPALAPQATPNLTLPSEGGAPSEEQALADELGIDVARITGKVKASSVKKISEVVESHPDESLQIIRAWLSESNERGDAA